MATGNPLHMGIIYGLSIAIFDCERVDAKGHPNAERHT